MVANTPISALSPTTTTVVPVRPGRATTQTTYQFLGEIPLASRDPQALYERAIEIVLEWLQRRQRSLPTDAWRGECFEVDQPGRKIECQSIAEEGIWAVRLEHPDDRVPERVWISDVSLRKRLTGIGFGIRVLCSSGAKSEEDITLNRPRVVRDLAKQLGLRETRSLDEQPWLIQSTDDLLTLSELLTNPERTLPVVALTQPDPQRVPIPVAEYVLDPLELASEALGLANIVQIPWDLAFQWTDLVGKAWSVFHGAVRTYMPRLDFERDTPTRHPLATVERIIFWEGTDLTGEPAFTSFLLDTLRLHAANKRFDWGDLLFISEARARREELARRDIHDIEALAESYDQEIDALKQQIEDLKKETDQYVDQIEEVEQERDRAREENSGLRYQVRELRSRLYEQTGEAPDASASLVDTYDDLPEWIRNCLAGRLELHSRAEKGLKSARFNDPHLVCRALLLLANEYRDMRLGEGSQQEYEVALQRLELRDGPSITDSRAGEEGETYYVRYPLPSSPRRFLELHLRKGSSKDERYSLAIYFFWDKDKSQVVVGWLPSHLDNRQT